MDFELQGKTAIITGAGGIICGVMAKKLAPGEDMRWLYRLMYWKKTALLRPETR